MDKTTEKIITLYVNPNQVVLANDQTLKADENGLIELYVNDLLIAGDKGFPEYDRLLAEYLSHTQREALYFMFLNNSRFGIQDTVTMLEVDRRTAKMILDLGMKQQVLKKVDTQKKIIPELKEVIKSHLNTMKRMKSQSNTTVKEIRETLPEVPELPTTEMPVRVAVKSTTLKKPINIPKKAKK